MRSRAGMSHWMAAFLLVTLCSSIHSALGKPPHIVLIVADDLGWNDVGFHNPAMFTPNIDKLAREGVILNQSYVQPVCTPTRHAIMTGYYPWKAGLQHLVIADRAPVCSPLNMKFFPEQLQTAGYKTHAIGKWHLGFCSWNCTPTYRGFDSFYGYLTGREDYFTHIQDKYLDFHDNEKVVWDKTGSYSADLYVEQAEKIIESHNKTNPLFLYLPFQNVHEPLQVPPQYEALYPNIQTKGRRTLCGMVTALDSAIGRIVEALQAGGLYDDTLFFFTPDNGGWIPFHGNNWPLRGGKVTVFEGGTRTAGFVSGAGLKKRGTTYDGMMHAVDWHPTILAAAGIQADDDIDGINQWAEISEGGVSRRTEFVYNLDDVVPPVQGHAAIRVGDYKLIAGYPGHDSGWYPPERYYGNYTSPEDWFRDEKADYLAFEQRVKMGVEGYYKLFNLKDDPTEHNDLSESMPEMVAKLNATLAEYHKQMVPANLPPYSPGADPGYFGDVWTPGWCKKPAPP